MGHVPSIASQATGARQRQRRPRRAGMPVGEDGRTLSGPSRRQIWITAVLMGALLSVGIVLLLTEGHGRSTPPAPTGAAATTSTVAAHDTLPIGSLHSGSAVALELALRATLGGCWDDAEPGGTDGAYRQDFPTGSACGGSGWDVVIELFDSNGQAASAVPKLMPSRGAYRSGNMLVVVASTADANTLRAVASQPGLVQVSPGS
jgi:hypothetical protein